MKLEVGQRVFVEKIGNAARHCSREFLVTESTVESIGRKYFTVEGLSRSRFFLDSGTEDGRGYISNHQVYTSKQEMLDRDEIYNKCTDIYRAFEYGYNRKNLTLEAIRTIHSMVFANRGDE